MQPYIFGVIRPRFLNQVPALGLNLGVLGGCSKGLRAVLQGLRTA